MEHTASKPNAASIGRLISKTISPRDKSKLYKGRITTQRTAGYEVKTAGNSVCVTFHTRTFVVASAHDLERNNRLRDEIANLLTSNGYTVERVTEKMWEPNAQATFGYYYPGDLRITKEAK